MKNLSPARLRAFLPACPPGPWLPLLAYVLVATTAVVLLEHGVPYAVLPVVLVTIGWLTIIVAGPRTRLHGVVIA